MLSVGFEALLVYVTEHEFESLAFQDFRVKSACIKLQPSPRAEGYFRRSSSQLTSAEQISLYRIVDNTSRSAGLVAQKHASCTFLYCCNLVQFLRKKSGDQQPAKLFLTRARGISSFGLSKLEFMLIARPVLYQTNIQRGK